MNAVNKTIYQEVLYKIPAVRRRRSKAIYKEFVGHSIDLTIVLHDYLNDEDVAKIKQITKSPVFLWFPDAISNFNKGMFFTAGYDRLFFCDKYIVKKLSSEIGLQTEFLPQCFSPERQKPVELTTEDQKKYGCDLTNMGNLYPSRAALYKNLTSYKMKFWGAPPPIWLNVSMLEPILMREEVIFEEKAKAIQAAKIVLNNLHPAVIDGVNKRAFEISAHCGFQIASYRPAITELFDDGKEIVCYHSLEDLKEKIDFYLKAENEVERRSIAEAGYRRAIRDHTYEKRIGHILSVFEDL
jgi:spore maturation protein CgeB